ETTEETTGFFSKVVDFRLAAHAVAVARAKADPDAEGNTEPEAAAAVNAVRHLILAGSRNLTLLPGRPPPGPPRQDAQFTGLPARVQGLSPADAKTRQPAATTEDNQAARRTILATLEALAGPPPHARFVRRSLAQARQDLAQALLVAGRVEDARLAFDDALLA